MILQGVVDGSGMFWNVFSGLPWSLRHAEVLRLSAVWELALRGNLFPAHTRTSGATSTGYYILGDSSYPQQDWLVTPFSDTGALTAQQLMLNQKISKERVVVKEVFMKLIGRWHCLVKRNTCDFNLVRSTLVVHCTTRVKTEGTVLKACGMYLNLHKQSHVRQCLQLHKKRKRTSGML